MTQRGYNGGRCAPSAATAVRPEGDEAPAPARVIATRPFQGCGRVAAVDTPASAEIDRFFGADYGRAVAVLVRVLGDVDLAEDAVQDAFAEAVRRWLADGPPPSPAGLDHHHRGATGRSIGCAARSPAKTGTLRPALLHTQTEPAGAAPCATADCA
jgi:hypothetical protein